jgi:hypothetical protein
LERSERHADSGRNIKAGLQEQDQDSSSEFWRLGLSRGKIVDDGTPYENLILKLYETKIELWSANPRYSLSSLEEFGQFRSKYETMPEEQLPEEIRKQEKENRRKWLATATPEVKRKDHIPSDLVVNRWASDVESGSHLDLLLQDDV